MVGQVVDSYKPDSKVGIRAGECRGRGTGTQELGFSHRWNKAWQRWPRAQPYLAGLGATTCEAGSDEKKSHWKPSAGTKVPPRLETGRVWTLLTLSQAQTQLSLRLSAGPGSTARPAM